MKETNDIYADMQELMNESAEIKIHYTPYYIAKRLFDLGYQKLPKNSTIFYVSS